MDHGPWPMAHGLHNLWTPAVKFGCLFMMLFKAFSASALKLISTCASLSEPLQENISSIVNTVKSRYGGFYQDVIFF